MTRALLKASEYTQVLPDLASMLATPANRQKVPQLCVGWEMDLDQPLII
jgi:hypothetical protein